MFDRCRVWRSLLNRRAEGVLSPGERALLNEHITKCAACRKAEAADDALQSACVSPVSGTVSGDVHSFDDQIVRALRAMPLDARAPVGWRERVRACSTALSFEFCMQLAGGALAAAAITGFVIVSALKPAPSSKALTVSEAKSMSALQPTEPPVPLESLFQSSTPRAAMLWAPPGRSPLRSLMGKPAISPRTSGPGVGRSTAAPRRHGQRTRGPRLS